MVNLWCSTCPSEWSKTGFIMCITMLPKPVPKCHMYKWYYPWAKRELPTCRLDYWKPYQMVPSFMIIHLKFSIAQESSHHGVCWRYEYHFGSTTGRCPMVMIPLGSDQPGNSARAQHLGVSVLVTCPTQSNIEVPLETILTIFLYHQAALKSWKDQQLLRWWNLWKQHIFKPRINLLVMIRIQQEGFIDTLVIPSWNIFPRICSSWMSQ